MKKQIVLLSFCALMSTVYGQQDLADLKFGPQKEVTGNRLDDIVAVVGDDVVTRKEINAFPKKQRKRILQQIIMQKLLLQAAKRYNITVSDTAINIAANKNKLRKGSKSRERLRDKLIVEKLQQQVVNSLVQISDGEVADKVDKYLRKNTDKIHLVDVLISAPKSSNAQVLNHAQETKREVLEKLKSQSGKGVAAQYKNVSYNDLGWVELGKIPVMFSKALLDAPLNQYAQPIVDQDGIHILKVVERKQAKKKGLFVPQARVSHILIKSKDNPQAKNTIYSLYKQLKKGVDFATLATQYSQDAGSAANGGSLGWVSPREMVPAFDKTMNKTKVGAISRPFKSTFGYHILKVEERRKLPINNRQLLERQARQAIFQQRATQEWELWLSRLREEAHIEIRDTNL